MAFSRRRFLALSAQGGLGLLALSVPLAGCRGPVYPPEGVGIFSAKEATVLGAAVEALLPDRPGMARVRDVGIVGAIAGLLGPINPAIAQDFRQLLDTLDDVPLLSFSLTPFSALGEGDRLKTLEGWGHSWLALKRRGFQGLKKIAASAFYGKSETWHEIGYEGPWVGRIDVGTGLDNQGPQPPLNPNILLPFEG